MNWLRPRHNQPAEPAERTEKFLSPRDELLYQMAANGWCNESSGSTQAPCGRFARVGNEMDDVLMISDAFGEDMDRLGLAVTDIIGHYLVIEDELAFVDVEQFETAIDLVHAYQKRDSEFKYWMVETGGDR